MYKLVAVFLTVSIHALCTQTLETEPKPLLSSPSFDVKKAHLAPLSFNENMFKRSLGLRAMISGIYFYEKQLYKKAFEYFARAHVESNLIEATYFLGAMYLEGQGVEKDLEHGVTWLTKAMNSGCKPAAFDLGLFYLFESQDQDRLEKAVICFMQYLSDPEFKFYCGLSLLSDNQALSTRIIKEAAKKGCDIARKYLNGDSELMYSSKFSRYVSIDNIDRFDVLAKATEAYQKNHHEQAMHFLASKYINYEDSAEYMYFLGHMYLSFKKDQELGLKYMAKAMGRGFKPAAFDLALRFFTSDGLKKNLSCALEIFNEHLDDAKFQYHAGLLLSYSPADIDQIKGKLAILAASVKGYPLAQDAMAASEH